MTGDGWMVLLVKPGAELAVLDRLWRLGVSECWLPDRRYRKRAEAGRRRRGMVIGAPLLPGYLFVRLTIDAARADVAQADRAYGFLHKAGSDQPVVLSQDVVDRIVTVVGDDVPVLPGDIVEIVMNSPWDGYRGQVNRVDNRGDLLLSLQVSDTALSVRIARADVAPVTERV